MRFYKLQKVALKISNNPAKFLNGITSNALDRPRSAFVDFHGKIVATFDQLSIDGENHLIVVEEIVLDSLMKHLERYILLSKAIVERQDCKVYFDLDGTYKKNGDAHVIPQRKGQLVLTRENLENTVAAEDFTLFRLQNNIPVQGIEYNNDFLLNVDESEFVSFTKGCFLGQEFLSKVHNRSKPSWKLVAKFEDDCTAEEKQKMTSKTLDPQAQKILGFVFVSNLPSKEGAEKSGAGGAGSEKKS